MEKRIGKEFAKYVSMNVAGMLGVSLYILADTFFVSKALGSNGLAALNFAIAAFNVMQGLGQMTGIGGAAKSSILRSLGKNEDSEKIFMNSLYIGMTVGILLMFTGVFFTTEISQLLGADSETLAHTEVYLCTMLCISPCFIMNYITMAFVRNDGNPAICMAAMLTSSMANILLDYIFIYPCSMGMYGAVFATGVSPIISLSILSIHLRKSECTIKLKKCRAEMWKILSVLKLGVSSFITELSAAVTVMAFNLILLKINGNTGVAAYGIIANAALVATSVFGGISQGVQPLASRCCGERDGRMLARTTMYSAITVIVTGLVMYISVYFGADAITGLFNSENNKELAGIAVKGLKFYFLGYIFAGVNIVSAAFFSAVDMPKYASIVSLMRSAVLIIPAVIIMSKLFGISGVWLSFVLIEAVTCIAAGICMIRSGAMRGNLRKKES